VPALADSDGKHMCDPRLKVWISCHVLDGDSSDLMVRMGLQVLGSLTVG